VEESLIFKLNSLNSYACQCELNRILDRVFNYAVSVKDL